MAVTANQLAVALFDAAVGGYKDTVDAFIYAQGDVSAAEMMLRESGLASNPDNSVFAYLVVAKMTGDTLTEAQKEAAADILVGWLAAGQSRGQVVLAAIDYLMSEAAAADATYGNAAMRFQNKVIAADNYAGTSTDVATLVAVLAGVTEDPATIDTAAQGDTFVLTTISETVVGTVGNDVIKGIFGDDAAVSHSTTYGAGDDIDGGTGADTLELTAVDNADPSATIAVKNVETITITDLHGAEFTATLVENAPAINFVGTLAGNESSVTDADLASVIGLSGKGDLTVDYASSTTTALTDAANVSLAGAGTSTSARSTVTVSDGNTIDSVSIATSGTNYVHLVAGTAAKTLTITGDGTNNIDMSTVGDIAAIVTIDASASTGTNTLSVGSTLNTTDVVKGGTGADTLSANFTLATLIKPTITGVETLKADFDAAAIVDLSATTGLTTITLDGSSANQELTKAAATVTTLNVTSQADGDNDIDFSHATDANAALTLNVGTTASTAANITLDTLTLDSTALTLNTVGTKDYVIGTIDLNGDQSAIAVNANADLQIGSINVDGGDVGSFDITVGADAVYSGGLYMSGDLGAVSMTVGDGSYAQAYVSNVGNVGDVTIEGTGEADMGFSVSGSLGDISITLDSQDASGSYFGAMVSGGSIGDITVSLDNGATLNMDVSANSFDFPDTDETGTDGNVGDVTLTLGDNTMFSGNIEASGGDFGNISVTVAGANASGNLDIYASNVSGDTDNDSSADDYVRGGNVGDVTLDITGDNANFNLYVLASGGDIGDVVFNVTGQNASGYMELHANLQNSGGIGGDIGTVTIEAGDGDEFQLDLTADGEIGAVTVTMATDASGSINISGGNSGAAMLSDVTVDMGNGSDFDLYVGGFGGDVSNVFVTEGDNTDVLLDFANVSGDIGNISITTGDSASGNVYFSGNDGNIGDVTFDGGADSEFYLAVSGAGAESIGTITVIGGDSASSAGIYVSDEGNMIASIGGVDASTWAGDLGIDLEGVTTGTTIQTGTGTSWVRGTEGADNIFLGTGVDTVEFDGTPTTLDEIFSFQKAEDVMDFVGLGFLTAENAIADDAAATTVDDTELYVFADGSNATTVETITDFADLADVAAFLAGAFSDEADTDSFVAVINTGGGAAYAYSVEVAGGSLDSADIMLIGIAHTDGALTTANTDF